MFQNLQTIRWAPEEESHFHYIHLFLGPRIAEVYIQHVTPVNIPLLPALGVQYPGLKSLALYLSSEDRALKCRASSKVALKLEQIEALSLAALDRDALKYLSRLPTLRSLDLSIPSVEDLGPISSPSYHPFLTLSAINLWKITVDFGIEFVHSLAACHLIDFTLHTQLPQVLATKSTTKKLYTALAGHLGHDTLRILDVSDVEGVDTPNPPADATIADYLVSGFTLLRLLCFGNLTSVDLRPPVGFDIDDCTAWDIARAWPKLRSLGLQAATDLSHRPSMTLHGLRAFAKHCPDLFGLVIAVDASMVPAFDGSPNTQICQRRLTSFNVSASPISNAAVVARFLSAMFPCISYMGTLHEWRWEEPAENDENEEMAMERAHHFRWKQVEETIPVMATMPAECREKIT
ncbi:hypothetical protein C8R43DRAFT_1141304 [Mycena crocata]|nr:hypothetical protein C8R43DRAFT_1141304 [Mycena crocata]